MTHDLRWIPEVMGHKTRKMIKARINFGANLGAPHTVHPCSFQDRFPLGRLFKKRTEKDLTFQLLVAILLSGHKMLW